MEIDFYTTIYKAGEKMIGSHCPVFVLIVRLTILSSAHKSVNRDLSQDKTTRRSYREGCRDKIRQPQF